jgi:hypothetical protein
MMPRWIRFLERKPNGSVSEALGSDSVLPVNSYFRHGTHNKALAHARSLKGVGKRYIGYNLLNGSSLLNATAFNEIWFTEEELDWS